MQLTKRTAEAIKCLGGKLEIVASDPDPKAWEELTKEYNCANCYDAEVCRAITSQMPLIKIPLHSFHSHIVTASHTGGLK